MKACTKCGEVKSPSEFATQKNRKDGLTSSCKVCFNIYARKRYLRKCEELREKQKVYALANKERLDVYRADYRVKNKPKIQEKKKRDYLKDPQKVIERSTAWIAANPEVHKAHFHNTRAKKKGVQGQLSRDLISRLLVEQNNCCAACKQPLDKPYHVDHIVALSKGGLNIDSNIQLLHPLCNAYKGVRSNEEFLQRLNQGKL